MIESRANRKLQAPSSRRKLMRPFLPAVALLALGSSALAGPKPPASATFEPEIGYTYASGNYMDLRLANRAGDKAILVHRTGFGALRSFDLSPSGSLIHPAEWRQIAYADGSGLYHRPWNFDPEGRIVIGSHQLLYGGPGVVEGVDLHPDRNIPKLAFSVIGDGNFAGIYVSDIFGSTIQTPIQILTGWNVFSVRWHPGNLDIFFSGYRKGTSDPVGIHRLFWGTFTVSPVIENLQVPVEFDVVRPPTSGAFRPDGFALNAGASGGIRSYSFAGVPGPLLAEGRLAHFNCASDAIIHRAAATRKPPTRITYLSGGFETWSTDSNIHHTDWIPRSPCV